MIMDSFKKILEIENKYNYQINLAKKRLNNKKNKCIEDFKLKEEVFKLDFKKELNNDFNKKIQTFNSQAESIIQLANEQSNHLKNRANTKEIIAYLLEELKNV